VTTRRTRRISYANVTSTLALCFALAGTSYAAVTITGKEVKNGSLSGKDLKRNALTSREIKSRSLLAADFKPGELPSSGERGPQGVAGPQGPQGPQGPRGPAGEIPDLFEDERSTAMDATDFKTIQAGCPLGALALGGGYDVTDNHFPPQVEVTVMTSMDGYAYGTVGPGWVVSAKETEPTDMPWKLTAWVSCVG
jgi:hypothetical protein